VLRSVSGAAVRLGILSPARTRSQSPVVVPVPRPTLGTTPRAKKVLRDGKVAAGDSFIEGQLAAGVAVPEPLHCAGKHRGPRLIALRAQPQRCIPSESLPEIGSTACRRLGVPRPRSSRCRAGTTRDRERGVPRSGRAIAGATSSRRRSRRMCAVCRTRLARRVGSGALRLRRLLSASLWTRVRSAGPAGAAR
jgi:hypothetical protein